MNNKDLISFMEKLGGSNEIKINGLANMLVDTVGDSESSGTTATAYTSSILDLFASSDSESSYDSEGGKGKTKSPKNKKSKKSKSKKPKKDKKKKSDSDSDSLLDHIESDTPVAKTTVIVKPQPVQTGIPSLAALASSLFGTNTQPIQQLQPTQYVSNPQPVPQLINLANPTNPVGGFVQPAQSGLVTLQVTPQQAQVLAPIIAQMSSNPNIRLSGGNIDVDLERVDNEIAELSRLLGL